MSGGSFNYLCHVGDLEDLINREQDLREMSDYLAALGYAPDAARETEELLASLRQWKNYAELRLNRLADVWKAAEWWVSCDWSEDRLTGALSAYRGEACGHEKTYGSGRLICSYCGVERTADTKEGTE